MKNKKLTRSLGFGAAAVAAVLTLRVALAAGIPSTGTLAYAGTLFNSGQPDNSSHFIIVKLWASASDAGSGASPACSTIPTGNTQLTNGRFTIPLDSSCVPVIHQDPNVQVEVVVDGTSMGKSQLSAVPYAVEADTASNAAPGSAIDALVPAGTVIAFAGVVSSSVQPPTGWLLCDGSAVSRNIYSRLFGAIGTTAGSGDGSTTFNLPDYRGYFLRGLDQGTGRDPDGTQRTSLNTGGNTGDEVGTYEPSQFASHTHGISDPGHSHGVNDPGHSHSVNDPGHSHGVTDPGHIHANGLGPLFAGLSLTANGNFVAGNPPSLVVTPMMPAKTGISIQGSGTGIAVQGSGTGISIQSSGTGVSVKTAGGSESRPANVAVNYLIKY